MVLQTVVDDFGKKIDVGNQMDVVEYLLNFIERLEEGLGESPQPVSANTSSKDTTRASDMDISLDLSIGAKMDSPEDEENNPLYTSYMVNTEPVDARPLRPKEFHEYTDKIGENFFGE